ncbi:uncharacterized protein LOC133807035 [Humulus lupulus]|uniref:uncharacterized protein LOC133807035 n=1 Tax=Humulus lupulus TaxID=3486 RepID=UPI002B411B04|nr:uncharacterized protein LOC133807035 [Humulus lupulus]
MAENKSLIVTDVVLVKSKITDHKLNGSNYLDWSKTVSLYLRSIDKDDHLTNDPPKDDSKEKADLTWLREDARLFLQIQNSIDSEDTSASLCFRGQRIFLHMHMGLLVQFL